MKINFIMACGLSWLLSAVTTPALGMDRLAALSLVESGNNDAAIGRAGEVSRYQIKPRLWEKCGCPWPLHARTNPQAARCVAQAIMRGRCANFEHQFHRPPNDFEYYILWNAPAQIGKPGLAVSARANRFSNLLRPWPGESQS